MWTKQMVAEALIAYRNLYPIEDVTGLTGERIRQLLNGLVAQSDCYLECGVYCGLSFTSATYGNGNLSRAIAIDNWAEKFGVKDPRQQFHNAIDRYFPRSVPLSIIEKDHWSVTVLPGVPDVFYYDGAHDAKSQERALTHFGPMCTKRFVYCCDDYSWPEVKAGTEKGLKGFRVLWDIALGDMAVGHLKSTPSKNWWNGFYVALLEQE